MSKALPLFSVVPQGSLAENAPLMLYTRYSEMISFAAYIHESKNVAELHNMRIAAKRLRYTLEIFAPVFQTVASDYSALTDQIKGVQEKIGDIHDCDVRIVQIRDYLDQNVVKKPEIRIGLQTLIERETATRHKLYEGFVKHWDEINQDTALERKFVQIVFAARIG